MSYAFYDGLRAVEEDPFKVALLVRRTLNPIFFKRLENIEARVIELGPEADLQEEFLLPKPLKHTLSAQRTAHDIVEVMKQTSDGFMPGWDIGYDVELLPSATGGAPLAFVLSGNKREYIKALIEANVFVEYGYWDNADEDDEVTVEEWAERKAAWGLLLTEDDRGPESIGLSVRHPSSFQYALYKNAREAQEAEFSIYWQ